MPDTLAWSISVLGAYLIGSVPFGYLMGRARGVDLRTLGSGNIGATNAMRQLGVPIGVACFVLDCSKGAVPTLLAGLHFEMYSTNTPGATHAWWWVATACATVMGHMFSVYLRFQGGKGIATTLGAMLALYPHTALPTLLALVAWVLALLVTRYVGISSCIAAITLPSVIAIRAWQSQNQNAWELGAPFLLLTSVLMLIVLVKHRGNIRRTIAGTEPRIGRRNRERPDASDA
ncbi:MAG: glycerol-3-phosphate 1-O-acyltransferase PlsY [Planctomycetota bacterium]|jgi:glycerol-3-phosphate acyltransferase PlsY